MSHHDVNAGLIASGEVPYVTVSDGLNYRFLCKDFINYTNLTGITGSRALNPRWELSTGTDVVSASCIQRNLSAFNSAELPEDEVGISIKADLPVFLGEYATGASTVGGIITIDETPVIRTLNFQLYSDTFWYRDYNGNVQTVPISISGGQGTYIEFRIDKSVAPFTMDVLYKKAVILSGLSCGRTPGLPDRVQFGITNPFDDTDLVLGVNEILIGGVNP